MKGYRSPVIAAAALVAASAVWVSKSPPLAKRHEADSPASRAKRDPAKAVTSATKQESASVLLKRLLEGGEMPRLTPEELKAFVEKSNQSAASLLASWQLGSDPSWLEEAVHRHPDDPRVALAKLSTLKELNAEAKEWIDRLKRNDPENAVGWCYDAMSALKSGSNEEAREALAEAAQKGHFGSSFKETANSFTAAYQSAGYDGFVSELLGTYSVPLPQAQLAQNLAKETLAKLGPTLDDAVVQNMLAITQVVRGQADSEPLIMGLVSASMEKRTLDQLNALELVPGTRKIVTERLDELDQERSAIKEATGKSAPLLSKLNESELKQYFRRSMVEGELKAMQWLINQHPEAQ